MDKITIVETDKATVVMDDDFKVGKGFIFPYGQVESDELFGLDMCTSSLDSENHEQARGRLLEIAGGAFPRQNLKVRLPRLGDIAYIFGYIANLQDTVFSDKFVSLLSRQNFFGFDMCALLPGKGIVICNDERMYKLLSQGRRLDCRELESISNSVVQFAHAPGGYPDRTSNYWRYSRDGLNGSMVQLEKIIGKTGVLGVKRLLNRTSPVGIKNIHDVSEVAESLLSLPE